MSDAYHLLADDEAARDGFLYSAAGEGVRADLVEDVLKGWASISPTGDPAQTLQSVNDGAINRVENLARIAALAVAANLAVEQP